MIPMLLQHHFWNGLSGEQVGIADHLIAEEKIWTNAPLDQPLVEFKHASGWTHVEDKPQLVVGDMWMLFPPFFITMIRLTTFPTLPLLCRQRQFRISEVEVLDAHRFKPLGSSFHFNGCYREDVVVHEAVVVVETGVWQSETIVVKDSQITFAEMVYHGSLPGRGLICNGTDVFEGEWSVLGPHFVFSPTLFRRTLLNRVFQTALTREHLVVPSVGKIVHGEDWSYEGGVDWQSGTRSGQGECITFRHPQAVSLKECGYWFEDALVGSVTVEAIMLDGSTMLYRGEVQSPQAMRHGMGELLVKTANGCRVHYRGEFRYNRFEGNGWMMVDRIEVNGSFEAGQLKGDATVKQLAPDGGRGGWVVEGTFTGLERCVGTMTTDEWRYEGPIVQWRLEGPEGVRTWFRHPDRLLETGTFANHHLVAGKIHFRDGSWYEGRCVDGLPQGMGWLRRSDDVVVYEGEWQKGKFHGQGRRRLTFREFHGEFCGGVWSGTFEDGVMGVGKYQQGVRWIPEWRSGRKVKLIGELQSVESFPSLESRLDGYLAQQGFDLERPPERIFIDRKWVTTESWLRHLVAPSVFLLLGASE